MDEDRLLDSPSTERVRRRAWALSAVSCRAFLESFDNKAEAADLHARLIAWIDEIDLRSEFEPKEVLLVDALVGSASQQAVVSGTWRSEGLAVLAWALQASPLPAHDEMVDPAAIANSVLFLAEDAPGRAEELQLRPPAELSSRNAVELAVHWRLREFSLRPQAMDFRTFPETAWFGPLNLDGVSLADDDLAIDGVSIANATPERVAQCSSIAMERHQAINWLCGWHPTYSEVDTST